MNPSTLVASDEAAKSHLNCLRRGSLGEVWFNLVQATHQRGALVNDECRELLTIQVAFPASIATDVVLERLGDRQMVAEIEKVFFSDSDNALGHSYARLMSGPGGRRDLEDVISLLRSEPFSKRAVVTLSGRGNGQVPCVNVVQFLVRGGAVMTLYFARGQDAFRKFYADGLCLAKMACRVAAGLGLAAGTVEGFIASSHVYERDRPEIERFLAAGAALLARPRNNGGL